MISGEKEFMEAVSSFKPEPALTLEERLKRLKSSVEIQELMMKPEMSTDDDPNMDHGKKWSLKYMTFEELSKILKSDPQHYTENQEFNTALYLHDKKFDNINHLDGFTNLKTLYLNQNRICRIQGLDKLTNLTSLYLNMNLIKRIEGLETLSELRTLNLAENLIKKVEGLGNCLKLDYLNLSMNRIGKRGLSDIEELSQLHELTALDLSNNFIEVNDEKEISKFFEIMESMEQLGALYTLKNPIWRDMAGYRKLLLGKLKKLTHMDDMLVTPEERRLADAFARGGSNELQAERVRIAEDHKKFESTRTDFLKNMIRNKDQLLKETKERHEQEYQESLFPQKFTRKLSDPSLDANAPPNEYPPNPTPPSNPQQPNQPPEPPLPPANSS